MRRDDFQVIEARSGVAIIARRRGDFREFRGVFPRWADHSFVEDPFSSATEAEAAIEAMIEDARAEERADKDRASRRAAFVRDLTALSNRHGFAVKGCGCCNSPSLSDTEWKRGQYVENTDDYAGPDLLWRSEEGGQP